MSPIFLRIISAKETQQSEGYYLGTVKSGGAAGDGVDDFCDAWLIDRSWNLIARHGHILHRNSMPLRLKTITNITSLRILHDISRTAIWKDQALIWRFLWQANKK